MVFGVNFFVDVEVNSMGMKNFKFLSVRIFEGKFLFVFIGGDEVFKGSEIVICSYKLKFNNCLYLMMFFVVFDIVVEFYEEALKLVGLEYVGLISKCKVMCVVKKYCCNMDEFIGSN